MVQGKYPSMLSLYVGVEWVSSLQLQRDAIALRAETTISTLFWFCVLLQPRSQDLSRSIWDSAGILRKSFRSNPYKHCWFCLDREKYPMTHLALLGYSPRFLKFLLPMLLGIDSRTRRNVWVEFVVGSLLCSEKFFLRVLRFFRLLKNQHFQILSRSRFQWVKGISF